MSPIKTKLEKIEEENKHYNEQKRKAYESAIRQQKLRDMEDRIGRLTEKEAYSRKQAQMSGSSDKRCKYLSEAEEHKKERIMLQDDLNSIKHGMELIHEADDEAKVFNKYTCLSNIRELLKDSEVKLGTIEKDAGCQPGYMSRLEKPDNKTSPSIDFLITAARALGTTVDTLISVDMTTLTPTEQYLTRFFDKLIKDTLNDEIAWNCEKPNQLDNLPCDINGNPEHVMFDLMTFLEESMEGPPMEVTRVTFNSRSFGPTTGIKNNCYNVDLGNGARLFLMDICKSSYYMNDKSAFAKEIWIYKPRCGTSYIAGTKDTSVLAEKIPQLYDVVSKRAQRPQISEGIKEVIDMYLEGIDIPF